MRELMRDGMHEDASQDTDYTHEDRAGGALGRWVDPPPPPTSPPIGHSDWAFLCC
eukprot:COSAG01_NODE_3852_length_5629_cov_3.080108_2_plen_55_part_00